MNTPVWDYIQSYVNQNPIRLHMPGHKGQGQQEQYDLTEVEGADVLYHAEGILKESMENAAKIFGSGKTVYSAEGASLAIRAMVYLLKLRGNKIAAARNAHSTFVTAAALLDMDVQWLYGENLLSCLITPAELERFLQKNDVSALAVHFLQRLIHRLVFQLPFHIWLDSDDVFIEPILFSFKLSPDCHTFVLENPHSPCPEKLRLAQRFAILPHLIQTFLNSIFLILTTSQMPLCNSMQHRFDLDYQLYHLLIVHSSSFLFCIIKGHTSIAS